MSHIDSVITVQHLPTLLSVILATLKDTYQTSVSLELSLRGTDWAMSIWVYIQVMNGSQLYHDTMYCMLTPVFGARL